MVFSCGQLPITTTSVDVTASVEQLSVAVAVPVLAGRVLAEQAIVTFTGHEIEGTTLSTTVMVCVQVEEFPHSSNAFHVRDMVLFCTQTGDIVTASI